MKTKLIIAFMMVSSSALAQFPAPTNLFFGYQYIMIDQSGYCDGHWISGPAYCSTFDWSAPDTSTTTAILDHYNLYYNQYLYEDTVLVLYATLQDTTYTVLDGFIGEMWVTASYSEPQGESEPSNIEVNTNLPINVDQTALPEKKYISYDQNLKSLRIDQSVTLSSSKLYDSQGRSIQNFDPLLKFIPVNQLDHGLYIIEIKTKNNIIERLKFFR